MKRKLLIVLSMVCSIGLGVVSHGAQAVEWKSLSEAEQTILKQHESQWDALPPAQRERLARGAERWLALSPEEFFQRTSSSTSTQTRP